jgi:uncharacterized protein YqhQ
VEFRGTIIIINMDRLTVKRGILHLLSTKAMGVKGILLQSKMFSLPIQIIQYRNNKKTEGSKDKHWKYFATLLVLQFRGIFRFLLWRSISPPLWRSIS